MNKETRLARSGGTIAETDASEHDLRESDETPFPFIGELRQDEDFDTPRCNERAPFDPDAAFVRICHLTAGAATNFTPQELRDWFRSGDAPTARQREAVSEALMHLGCAGFDDLARNSGASIREIARFIRTAGPRHWTTVRALNLYSKSGNDELPREIDKPIVAGDYHHWI